MDLDKPQRVHICHIQTTFRLGAGSTKRTCAIIKGFSEKGYKVSLIVGRDSDELNFLSESGVSVYIIPVLRKYISPLNEIAAFIRLLNILKEIEPDVVHTHLAKAGILGRFAAKLSRVPVVLHTIHGPTFPPNINWLKRNLYRFLERKACQITDFIFFVGEELRESYISVGAAHMAHSAVVKTAKPFGNFDSFQLTSEDFRKQFCHDQNCFIATYIGRVVPSKQQADAIYIISGLREEGINIEFFLIGEAFLEEEKSYIIELKHLVRELNIENVVHFLGFRNDAINIMSLSDIVIFTSKYEGLPNVPIEASMVGTPVIAYDVCGIREIIEHGKTGYVVPQGDQSSFCYFIKKLYFNPELKTLFGDTAKGKDYSEYDEQYMVKRKLSYYEKILKSKFNHDIDELFPQKVNLHY